MTSTSRSLLIVIGVLAALATSPAQSNLPAWGYLSAPERGVKDNALHGVAASSPNDVWAVGEFNPNIIPTVTGRRTLTEHWDGSNWTIVKSPNPSYSGLQFASLQAVDKVSSTDLWAVGYSSDGARELTLIEHWDGSAWKIVPSPNPAGVNGLNELFDVLAIATNNVYAVGGEGYDGSPIILHWDGNVWHTVANGCSKFGELYGVTATSAADIWAVGENQSCHFDGSTWTKFAIPSEPGIRILNDVSAISPTDVWAVGYYQVCTPLGCANYPYPLHWDGSRWSVVPSPGSSLNGVLAQATNDVWAVGTSTSFKTLVVHWDGATWSTVPSPTFGTFESLNEIAAAGPDNFWAVGEYTNKNNYSQNIILQAPSATQGTLTGNVNRGRANITWIGSQSGSTTADPSGDYGVAGIPAGQYTVTVSANGCTPASTNLTIDPGQTTVQNFQLQCP